MRKLLFLLGLTGCTALEERVTGMDVVEAEEPVITDGSVGNIRYQEDGAVLYQCDECEDSIDISYALEVIGLYQYLDNIVEEGIDSVSTYVNWEAERSEYSREDAWINLNCADIGYFAAWVMEPVITGDISFYDEDAIGWHDVDSFIFMKCLRNVSENNDCNPEFAYRDECPYLFDYFTYSGDVEL